MSQSRKIGPALLAKSSTAEKEKRREGGVASGAVLDGPKAGAGCVSKPPLSSKCVLYRQSFLLPAVKRINQPISLTYYSHFYQ